MQPFFEAYQKFSPEEVISIHDVIEGLTFITYSELMEIIIRDGIVFFEEVVSLMDEETGDTHQYMTKGHYDPLDYFPNKKAKYIQRESMDLITRKYPMLKWKKVEATSVAQYQEDIARKGNLIDQYSARIKQLEDELIEYKNKLRTQNASEVKSEATVRRWIPQVETAVRLAYYCFNNKKTYTIADLEKACTDEKIGKLTREALNAFRKAMPEDYIKQVGAPSKQ